MALLRICFGFGLLAWACGFGFFIVAPNLVVATAAGQLPFGGEQVQRWQLDQPVETEALPGEGAVEAGAGRVPRVGYTGPTAAAPWGVPLRGPIQHWGVTHPRPLLGCRFRDPNYPTHVGADFPVQAGTPVYATLAGQVAWAGANGPWGLLVVIENGDYQIWLAHNTVLAVSVGQSVAVGQVVASSGNTGNSTGPHVHFGIKRFSDPADTRGVWLDPELFFSPEAVSVIGCGG